MPSAHDGSFSLLATRSGIVPLLTRNVSLNRDILHPDTQVSISAFDWRDLPPPELSSVAPFDLILGADVMFRLDLVRPLIDSLDALSDAATEILVAFEIRCDVTYAAFRSVAGERFGVKRVYVRRGGSGFVHIYQLRKKRRGRFA